MRYYLAYGSNLNKTQMAWRCPDAKPVCRWTMMDYQLVFRRGYLTIEPKEGESVPCGIWQISGDDERNLDRYEGYPRFYRKELFPAMVPDPEELTGRMVTALVYIMNPGFPIEPPMSAYVRTVDQGYADWGFDTDDWEKLFLAHMRSDPSFYTTVSTTKVDPK